MHRKLLAAAVVASVAASPASASIYTDEMGKCLVGKTTEADRTTLVKWIFAGVSVHPALQELTTLTPERRTKMIEAASALMNRLVLTDCRKQAIDALKYDGPFAMQESFKLLGEVAMRGMMGQSQVVAEVAKLDAYSDKPAWNALAKEAGIAAPYK